MQTAFLGAGRDMDYVVSDLFADDFKFNRYQLSNHLTAAGTGQSTIPAPKKASTRRRLIERSVRNEPVWLSIVEGDFDPL